ncbi:MAG: ABC transporter permease [Betaproteobacteria bacterium]
MSTLRIAARTLLRARGFSAAAVLILAVGIGAATIVFSVVDGIVLRALPYPNPDRLVLVWDSTAPYRYTAPADFLDWRRTATSFESLAAYDPIGVNLTGGGQPERLLSMSVSGNFFALLGATPLRGRTFLPAEDRPGAAREAVLSEQLWRRRYASNPAVVGMAITLNDQPYTVVGVMPDAFQFYEPVDLWTLGEQGIPSGLPFKDVTTVRDARFFYVIGRLRPGVSRAQAGAEMLAISRRLAAAHPATNANQLAHVLPLRTAIVGDVRPVLLMLLGAVAFLLLLACANVANLLLVRAAGRRREIGIRVALGGGKLHLVRQLLAESMLLAFAATGIGLILAAWGLDGLKALAPAGTPRLAEVTIDLRVLAFSVAAAVATGALFGLAPAIHLAGSQAGDALRSGGSRTTDSYGARLRNLLVVGEIALAEMLLIGAGLLLGSFLHLTRIDPGFNPDRLLTFSVALPTARYPEPAARTRFFHDVIVRLQNLPGVSSVGAALALPVAGGRIDRGFWIEGRPSKGPTGGYDVDFQLVNARYFQTMQIPLVEGRTFDERDDLNAPRVAVVSAAMARQYWSGEDPLGRRIGLGQSSSPDYWRTIVGVVGDVRQQALGEPPAPQVYVPYTQNREPWNFMMFAMRVKTGPAGLERAARAQVAAVDPDQPVTKLQTMEEALRESTRRQRFSLWLVGLFALVALALAAAGVYAVRAYAVASRTQELGIRVALGAAPGSIVRLVIWQGLSPTVVGVGAGLLGALALGHAMRGLLFEVAPTDPPTLAIAAIVLAGVSFVAAWIPARRATHVDPIAALRGE